MFCNLFSWAIFGEWSPSRALPRLSTKCNRPAQSQDAVWTHDGFLLDAKEVLRSKWQPIQLVLSRFMAGVECWSLTSSSLPSSSSSVVAVVIPKKMPTPFQAHWRVISLDVPAMRVFWCKSEGKFFLINPTSSAYRVQQCEKLFEIQQRFFWWMFRKYP